MRRFQLVIDLEVTDDTLTENSIVSRWKRSEEVVPGVTILAAVAVPYFESAPSGEGLAKSLADVPDFPSRLLNCCRNAGIHTVGELADTLTELRKFRGVGEGMIKQAIGVCIAAGAKINPDELELSHRTYALQLLARKA